MHFEFTQENLGEFLTGDRIENSPYTIYMIENTYCNVLCKKKLSGHGALSVRDAIDEEYHHNWIVDNLPAASEVDSEEFITTSYSEGFPVGYKEDGKHYLYNHVTLKLDYHTVREDPALFRVVGFKVEPFSVQHTFKDPDAAWDGTKGDVPPLKTCHVDKVMDYQDPSQRPPQTVKAGETVIYTYDVFWAASSVRWASRWDIYLTMDNAVPNRVHWFSIINSLLIVLFLTVMIAIILIRNLYRDIVRYNAQRDEDGDETGWKLVHTDVFRPPSEFRMLFCVCVGTGAQVIACALLTVLFASVGFLSPANRGSLMVALLLLYALMGSVSGYVSARLFKTFKGKTWQRCTSLTAFLFPGICFVTFLMLNVMMASYHSTGAVPFTSMLSLVGLWLFVSVPLVFLGAFIGYRREPIEFPVRFSVTPRPIPDQPWYLSTYMVLLVGGVLPFGACFVEVFFIMSSLWMGQYYYVFGFLFIVLVILLVTCAETAIVFTYFQLCNEDYRWWWRSFMVPGSTGLYVFLYSCLYFSRLEANLTVTYFLYFCYMVLVSGGITLITGTAGFLACLAFTRKIYSSIKVE